jgi:polyisoprenoid-binding protein YceI
MAVQRLEFDAAHSSVTFAIKHMMVATVRGQFEKVAATVDVDPANPAGATIQATIEAASINTGTPDRDAHLRSADFFETEKYPEITFKSTAVKQESDDQYLVSGDLTMHGVTRPVSLKATLEGRMEDPYGNERIAVAVEGEVNRKEFGLTWNQPLQSAGGLLVGETVKLTADVTLLRKIAVTA